jgi:hypothetical protein
MWPQVSVCTLQAVETGEVSVVVTVIPKPDDIKICLVDQQGSDCEPCPEGQHSTGGAGAVCTACPTGSDWNPATLKCDGE